MADEARPFEAEGNFRTWRPSGFQLSLIEYQVVRHRFWKARSVLELVLLLPTLGMIIDPLE